MWGEGGWGVGRRSGCGCGGGRGWGVGRRRSGCQCESKPDMQISTQLSVRMGSDCSDYSSSANRELC